MNDDFEFAYTLMEKCQTNYIDLEFFTDLDVYTGVETDPMIPIRQYP